MATKRKADTPRTPRLATSRYRHGTNESKGREAKRQAFALHVAAGKSHKDAARAAGCTGTGVRTRAAEMLKEPSVRAQVAAARQAAFDHLQVDVNVYFEQLHAIATCDIADILDDKGRVRPLSTIPARARMAMASLDLVMQNVEAGDGVVDMVLKPRFHSKLEAIITMLKAHGKLVTKIEKGRPGEFDRLSREQLRDVIEKELAPAAGLRLVRAK